MVFEAWNCALGLHGLWIIWIIPVCVLLKKEGLRHRGGMKAGK